MSNLSQDNVFKVIIGFIALFLVMNIGMEIYPVLNDNSMPRCTSGVIQERIERIEPTKEDGVSKVVKYYTLKCSYDGSIREVKTFKSYPIGTKIGLEWVRQ